MNRLKQGHVCHVADVCCSDRFPTWARELPRHFRPANGPAQLRTHCQGPPAASLGHHPGFHFQGMENLTDALFQEAAKTLPDLREKLVALQRRERTQRAGLHTFTQKVLPEASRISVL